AEVRISCLSPCHLWCHAGRPDTIMTGEQRGERQLRRRIRCRPVSEGAVEFACRFGQWPAHRGVDDERGGQLVDGEPVLHGHRDREDEFAGPRTDDDAAEDGARSASGEDLDEAVLDAQHLRPRVRVQRQHHGVDVRRVLAVVLLGEATVAISGAVNTFEATLRSLRGCTASPRAWFIAIRPCIAATEANGSTPVQSPAAEIPAREVRDTPSTTMCPESLTRTPAFSRPRSSVFGIEATAKRPGEASDRPPTATRT